MSYKVIGKWAFAIAGLFSPQVREIRELLPRYEQDNLFDSSKFKRWFPEFEIMTYRKGIDLIRKSGARDDQRRHSVGRAPTAKNRPVAAFDRATTRRRMQILLRAAWQSVSPTRARFRCDPAAAAELLDRQS
ncbi:hypothetical protein [Tahibacter caeni]|uniref:hypothetical protein n=1 Tax=Tahibacter caeni TaxID=1453545 RepID=UPI002148E591|nr:hypothetical protein [Tahibacter caeni]